MTLVNWLLETGDRLARILALIALAFASAVMIHQHSRQADQAPYVAVDDSLANISASMVALGRNGFPASPVQGIMGDRDPRRHQSQFNYGYAPFLLGAALDWLFGTSYPALRAVHVVGLILMIAIATAVFWSTALPAALLFAGVVATILWPGHWPMFRPDIGTALAGIGAIACATVALRTNSAIAWFATGFLASTAFGSHQIAWIMVPWAGAMWLVAVALAEPERRWSEETIGPLIVLVLGGLIGIIAYLFGIGWRIKDVLGFWSEAHRFLGERTTLPYSHFLAKHYDLAWYAVHPGWLHKLLVIALAAGLIASAIFWWLRSPLGRPIVALTVPGAAAAIGYLLSLGLYRNFHAGYHLFLQLATVWAGAAAVAALLVVAGACLGARARPALALLTALGTVMLVQQLGRQANAGTYWTSAGARYVPFSEYESRVFAEVPHGASALGDVIFGLRAGTRHHLVQGSDARQLLAHHGPTSQERLAPDHIVMREDIQDLATLLMTTLTTRPDPRFVERLKGFFGEESFIRRLGLSYGETSIVSAEPYGETRVYTRNGVGRPAVAIYDGESRTWLTRFAPADMPAREPAVVEMSVPNSPLHLKAAAGIRLHGEPGTLLVEVGVPERLGGAVLVSASAQSNIALDRAMFNPLGQASVGIAFPGATSLHVILRAPEGVGYIGYFGPPLAEPLAIKRIERLVVNPRRTTPLAVPPLAEWNVQFANGHLVVSEDGKKASIAGAGIPIGYQLTSPPIAVTAHTDVTVRFDVKSTGVTVGLGFLDAKGYWIEPPVRSGPLTINTRQNTSVRLLLTNFDTKASPAPARFELKWLGAEVSDSYSPSRLYVDALARCWIPPGAEQKIESCRK
jgi:MFS family permease